MAYYTVRIGFEDRRGVNNNILKIQTFMKFSDKGQQLQKENYTRIVVVKNILAKNRTLLSSNLKCVR